MEEKAQDIVNDEWVKTQRILHEEYTALLAEGEYEQIIEDWEGTDGRL